MRVLLLNLDFVWIEERIETMYCTIFYFGLRKW